MIIFFNTYKYVRKCPHSDYPTHFQWKKKFGKSKKLNLIVPKAGKVELLPPLTL